ncbi:metal ABC transporter substrate-binding protein [Agromyces mariniharenae]|uniref:Zinc ABC transporter substrate-binding protein n=1 Tax=Agromyces mariniharenae TaxID=2604423 RepID=A0A5S4V3J5_9MICO|nr:metal ABC transporter substrate-binding protein [Agromyces mariniharenae]TYL53604.1 zinc ABC transporter substrate-binding protein [Agromyces mariniharenae]
MTPSQRSVRRRVLTATAVGAALAAGVLALASCASPVASGTAGERGPSIVATTTQVGDFTRELVGDTADVTQLLAPAQSAHGFDPSAAQLLALADADALVVNGAGLESWLDDAVSASGFDGVLIDASTGIELYGTDDHDDDADADDADAAADAGHATSDDDAGTDADAHDDHAASDDHDGHDHGDGNPHIWTDPELAEHMVHNIAHGLETVPGIDAGAVTANEDAYLAQLEALDAWIEENVDTVPEAQRLLVTNHDAFTYFIDAYDLTFVGSVIPSFDDNAEPSAAEIDDLVAKIRATGVQAVFSEASISPKAAATIASEAGVTVYSGDDALYGDSLGVEGSPGETYLGSQVHNATLILESWGVTPSPLPAVLQG